MGSEKRRIASALLLLRKPARSRPLTALPVRLGDPDGVPLAGRVERADSEAEDVVAAVVVAAAVVAAQVPAGRAGAVG